MLHNDAPHGPSAPHNPNDDPQLGHYTVHRAALSGPVSSLDQLAAEFGDAIIVEAPDDLPTDGWRVLQQFTPDNALLGRPADALDGAEHPQYWHLGLFQRSWQTYEDYDVTDPYADPKPLPPRPAIVIEPVLTRLRPSRTERRRGLELRWPSDPHGSAPDYFIDLVNAAEQPWQCDGDDLLVVGVFTPRGATEFTYVYSRYMAGGVEATLAPGESRRLPVQLTRSGPPAPGPHDLHAILVDLDLHAPPLPLDEPPLGR